VLFVDDVTPLVPHSTKWPTHSALSERLTSSVALSLASIDKNTGYTGFSRRPITIGQIDRLLGPLT